MCRVGCQIIFLISSNIFYSTVCQLGCQNYYSKLVHVFYGTVRGSDCNSITQNQYMKYIVLCVCWDASFIHLANTYVFIHTYLVLPDMCSVTKCVSNGNGFHILTHTDLAGELVLTYEWGWAIGCGWCLRLAAKWNIEASPLPRVTDDRDAWPGIAAVRNILGHWPRQRRCLPQWTYLLILHLDGD